MYFLLTIIGKLFWRGISLFVPTLFESWVNQSLFLIPLSHGTRPGPINQMVARPDVAIVEGTSGN